MMAQMPETYYLEPTKYVPNSFLPVLVYRNVLGAEPSPSNIKTQIETNDWLEGGIFKTYPTHHFHSVTHECYAVIQGSSRTLLGRGPLDDAEGGIEVDMTVGDVIILPAGVSHCNTSSQGDYKYMGLYPKGSPRYDNNFCKANASETAEKRRIARRVSVPSTDPIYGANGPLNQIWTEAAQGNESTF